MKREQRHEKANDQNNIQSVQYYNNARDLHNGLNDWKSNEIQAE